MLSCFCVWTAAFDIVVLFKFWSRGILTNRGTYIIVIFETGNLNNYHAGILYVVCPF